MRSISQQGTFVLTRLKARAHDTHNSSLAEQAEDVGHDVLYYTSECNVCYLKHVVDR